MKAKDITKTELKKVAKELNEQMGLEPPILLDLTVKALKAKCIEAAAQIDLEQDEYSDGVWEVLGALGCDPRVEASEEGVDADTGEESPEEADNVIEDGDAKDAEDELVDEAMEDTLVEDFKAAKKMAELKELAQEWECFEKLDLDSYAGLQGPKRLRADMLECMPDDVRAQLAPKPVEKTGTKTTTVKLSKPKWKTVIELIVANPGITEVQVIQKLAEQDLSMSANTVSVYVREIGYALELARQK